MVTPIEAPKEQELQPEPDRDAEGDADDDREPEIAHELGQREGDIGPHHVEAAMGEIDYAHDAEDEREPTRHQEEQQPVLNAVQDLNEEDGAVGHGSFELSAFDRGENANSSLPPAWHRRPLDGLTPSCSRARDRRAPWRRRSRTYSRALQPCADRCPGSGCAPWRE